MEMDDVWELVESVQKVPDIQPWLDVGTEKAQPCQQALWTNFLEQLSSEEPYTAAKDVVQGSVQEMEDGSLKVSVTLEPRTSMELEAARYQKYLERLVWPRYFKDQQIYDILEYNLSVDPENPQNGEYRLSDYTVRWKLPEYGTDAEVWYRQTYRQESGEMIDGVWKASEGACSFYISDAEDPADIQSRKVRWEEGTFFEVSFERGKDGAAGARYFFWGDKANVFCLRVPYSLEDTVVREILNSIR